MVLLLLRADEVSTMKLFKRLAMLAASLSDRCGIATQILPLASSRFLPRRLTDLPQAKLRASSHESGVVAKGFEVVDLASGASSADTPAVLKDAAVAAINAGHNQYGQANGDLELRQLYAQRLAKSTGVAIDAQSEVTVVGGTSSALACVLLATIDAGDEVIVFAPYFEGYLQAIAVAQGVARPVALANQPSVGFAALPGAVMQNWTIDETALRAAITPKTRAIIVNSPHNPTGRVFTADELAIVADIAREHDLLVVSDEIYSTLVYGQHKHVSVLSLPGMQERSVVIEGLSKTHNASGWRIGLITAPPAITGNVRRFVAALGVSAPAPLTVASRLAFDGSDVPQTVALAQALAAQTTELEGNGAILRAALLRRGFAVSEPQGATYLFANLLGGGFDADGDLPGHLLSEYGIKVSPGTAFFGDEEGNVWVRFCFARSRTTIEEAQSRLLLKKLAPSSITSAT